ncbi:beta-1,3-glucan-binding protein-like [Battus philenor]|uniref:beta-1,3-glucan-binding protein-like n=1 Tax=Battus philenor TaxID=42288 RepID=UPI0035D035AC
MSSATRLLVLIILCGAQAKADTNTAPQPKLEAIHPKGFRVSIPDDGFTLFGFRGNLNQELNGLELGQWTKDVPRPTNGRWVFKDKNAKLKLGDTVYYWTFVMKNGAIHRREGGEWTVTEFVNEDGTPVNIQEAVTPDVNTRFLPTTPSPSASTNCPESPTAVLGRTKICQGELIFAEEFDRNSIEALVNWDVEVKFPQEPDYPFNVYLADLTLRLENGVFVASPALLEAKFHEGFFREKLDLTNTCTGQIGTTECSQVASGALILPPVITGKITTRNKFNFKFGRVEIRAKLPSGSWLLPEITLEPRDAAYGNKRYESGLIRVAFARGNAVFGKKLYGGPILSDTEPYRSLFMKEKIGVENWQKDFHNYSLVWKPDGMQLFVDGEQYGTVDPGEGFFASAQRHGVQHGAAWVRGTAMAPLDDMFYVALGLRVGGINDFEDGFDKPWKNRKVKAMLDFWKAKDSWFSTWYDANVKVDYVRIYAL